MSYWSLLSAELSTSPRGFGKPACKSRHLLHYYQHHGVNNYNCSNILRNNHRLKFCLSISISIWVQTQILIFDSYNMVSASVWASAIQGILSQQWSHWEARALFELTMLIITAGNQQRCICNLFRPNSFHEILAMSYFKRNLESWLRRPRVIQWCARASSHGMSAHISPWLQVQWCQIGNLNLAVVGVFV